MMTSKQDLSISPKRNITPAHPRISRRDGGGVDKVLIFSELAQFFDIYTPTIKFLPQLHIDVEKRSVAATTSPS